MELLFKPGNIVIAETYPAECYGWFFNERLKSKRTLEARRKVANSLKDWAASRNVQLVQKLRLEIDEGFHEGEDAFDAVIGLFGMLEVCLGHRTSGESKDENVKTVEGWILGRQALQR